MSNCLSFSCCTMIRGIAPHAPSVLFLPGIVFVLRASLTLFLRVYKFPASCMFPHSEYQTRLDSCLVLLDSSDKLKTYLVHSVHLRTIHTPNLHFSRLRTRTQNRSGTLSVPVHSGNPFQPPFEIPWTQLKVGAAHELKPFPGTLRTSEFPALISEDFK